MENGGLPVVGFNTASKHKKREKKFIKKTLQKRLNSHKRIGCNYQPVQTNGSTQDLKLWFDRAQFQNKGDFNGQK